jgi:hypothetical protein
MAISVDYSVTPYLITIPKSDLTLVTGNQYEITAAELWVLLREYADSEEALPFPIIYTNVPPTESGTPRIVEINENYYECQFELTSPIYNVDIVDGNTNFRTVEKKNEIGVGTNNTTGYSVVETGTSGLTAEESTWLSSVPNIEVDMDFLKHSLKGEKALIKVSSTWYLRIWDQNSPRSLILDKALKDANGNEIDDIAAGALAKELQSSV